MKNKTNLKKFLATASTFAVIAGASTSASAVLPSTSAKANSASVFATDIKLKVDHAATKLKEVLATKTDATDKTNIDIPTKAEQGSDAALTGIVSTNATTFDLADTKLKEVLATKTDATDKTNIDIPTKADIDKAEETIARLTNKVTVVDSIENVITSVGDSLGVRAMSLAGNPGVPVETRTVSSERVTGLSAGDEHARFGAWFSPFFSKTTQKARKGAAGYKGEAYGASFGFDTRANDDMIIGAAFTTSNTELKHKDFKAGDKTKVNSLLFSIYGMQQITDNWFALGSATFGSNKIKNNEKRVFGADYQVANAKYSSMSFSGKTMFGYNFITEQATITPMAGIRYTRVNDGGYKESGTAFQNLDVSTKASNKLEVIVGGRASGGTFDLNGLKVTPEIHGFINHNLVAKNAKTSIKLGSAELVGKSHKPAKTTYNLGLGVNSEFGCMEYGASYDAQLANKHIGHQGSLKVRVNF